jgi:KDO2-lipid IV(A) lauroyltransferase
MSSPPPPSIVKKASWRAQALAYDGLCTLLAPFSFERISAFGGAALRKIGPRTSKHQIILTGLQIAFPELGPKARAELALKSWDNIGRTFAEFPVTGRIKVFGPDSRVTIENLEILEQFITEKRPAICIGGHYANWEVMAAVLSQAGLPVHVTYRQLNNPYLDKRVRAQREVYGIKFMVRKSTHAGARVLLDALKSGDSIAIMNDQKFNEGISVPFFGQPAMTATGAVRLSLKTGIPLLPTSVRRDGAKFIVTIHPPIQPSSTGNRDADIETGVGQIIAYTEAVIRRSPDQWFWVHRRWPKALYKNNPTPSD